MKTITICQATFTNMKEVSVQDSAPTNPYKGQTWTDTSKTPPVTKIWDGSKWIDKLSDLENTVRTQTEQLSTHEAKISSNESAINLRVKTSDYNAYKQTVNSEIASAKSRLSATESSITAMQGQIALKVEQTDINTAVNSAKTYADNQIKNNDPLIVGTQTAVTGTWTGVAPFSTLSDGQRITYWLPYNGSGNATLNLTLSNGATTGAVNCYYSGTSRITTHYPAGNAIRLIYRKNVTINGTSYTGWWADANYDSNTYDRIRYNSPIKAASAITSGNIIVGNASGYHHLKTGGAFDIGYPILYSSSAIASGATGTNNYLAIALTITTTQSLTLTMYKSVYIKGTISGCTFTPVSTAPLTQTVPTTEDGYYYILLGTAYATKSVYLLSEHPIFRYVNGKFQQSIAQFENYSTTAQMQSAINIAKDSITQIVSNTYATQTTVNTISGNVTTLTNRVETAESKLTKDSLITTIGSYYATTGSVNEAITSVQTIATQTADKINWLVKSGTSATDFTLTDRTATLIAETISLNGNVKVSGAMLVDRAVTAAKIDVADLFAQDITATGTIKGVTLQGATGSFTGTVEATSLIAYEKVTVKQAGSGNNLIALQAPATTGVSSLEVGGGFGQIVAKKYLMCDKGIFSTSMTPPKSEVAITDPGSIWTTDSHALQADGHITASGEIVGGTSTSNAFRALYGSYGFIIRNDSNSTWFLLTDAGDAYGTFNSLRPIRIFNDTGNVTIGTRLDVNGAGIYENGTALSNKYGQYNRIGSNSAYTYNWRVTESGNFNPYKKSGTNLSANSANEYNIGNTGAYIKNLYYGGALSKQSDRRIKNDLGELSDREALLLLRNSKMKKFTYKTDKDKIVQYGAYAQDLRDTLIQTGIGHIAALGIDISDTDGQITTDLMRAEEQVRYTIDYTQYIAPLVVGWQDHDRKMGCYDSKLNALQTQLNSALAQIDKLREQLQATA